MYRTIDTSLWTDRKVRDQLPPLGKLLFVYLITNSHTHVSGLYYLPGLIIQHETGLSAKQLDTLSHTLSGSGFTHFDKPNELVWVVNMFNFQGRGEKNTLSAAHHLSKDVHNSHLINAFLERYPHVKPYMKDRVSNGVSEGDPPVPLPIPHSPIQRTEQEKGNREKTTVRKTRPPDFLPVTEEMREWAGKNEIHVNLETETEAMLDHFRGKGEAKLDWIATWRNWMRNTKKYQRGANGAYQQGSGQAAAPSGRKPGIPGYTPKQ